MKQKLLYITFCVASFAALRVNAQSNTRGISADTSGRMLASKDNTDAMPSHKILLIPFYPKMCMSEIGKDVHATTHLEYDQITQEFRRQMDLAMYTALRKKNEPISLLQDRTKSDSVLSYIYGSTGYKYDAVPGAIVDVGAPDDKAKKNKYVKNGQLEVPVDYTKRFMNINISNPHLLSTLTKKYSTDTYVFINELDIKNVDNNAENLNDATIRRQVSVHYCILDKDGKSIAKGLAETYFPANENDPKEIGEKYFSIVAHTILKDYAQGLTINTLADKQKAHAPLPK